VNKREQAILIKIYGGLNEMTSLNPLNPMNPRAISANLRTCTKAASDLMHAVFHLRIGEYEEAETAAADALSILEAGRK
jgi:hypothetical protein